MKRFTQAMKKPWLAATFALCSAVLLYLILTNINGIFSWTGKLLRLLGPLIAAAVLAYVLNPIANIFEYHILKKMPGVRARHVISVIIACLLVLILVALLLSVLIPSLLDSITGLIANADTYIARVDGLLQKLRQYSFAEDWDLTSIMSWVNTLLNRVFSYLSSNIGTVISTSAQVGAQVVNVIIVIILALYFLLGKYGILRALRRLRRSYLTDEAYTSHTVFFKRCHSILVRYIEFDLLDGLLVGAVNAGVMAIIGMPHIALISVIVGVANLVPTFGPVVGAVIGAILLLLTKPLYAAVFLLYTLVLQTLDGYVLKPRLYGDSMGVPPVWILVAIIVGNNLFGMVGMLLSIPITAIIAILYDEFFIPWMQLRKERRVRERAEDGLVPPPETEKSPQAMPAPVSAQEAD